MREYRNSLRCTSVGILGVVCYQLGTSLKCSVSGSIKDDTLSSRCSTTSRDDCLRDSRNQRTSNINCVEGQFVSLPEVVKHVFELLDGTITIAGEAHAIE